MPFRLRKETAFKFILLQTICFSCVTSSFSTRNLTIGLDREPEKVDHRRWRRDDEESQSCDRFKMRSLVTFPGESLHLRCSTCGLTDFPFSVWKIRLIGTAEGVKMLKLGREEIVREGTIDVAITNISPELGGTYTCLVPKTQGIYEIIVKTLPNFEVVFGQPPREDQSVEEGVFTNWGSWTKCSAAKCGTAGERSRIGWCNYRVRRQMYADGLPCRSFVVAQSIREKIKDIPDKKLIQACKPTCSGGNSKSSSLSKSIPKLPPIVTQKALYAKAGESVALLCSGVSVVAYIRWEIDGTMIRQVDLQREGNKHLTIDGFHTLHINGLRKSDAGIYSCWHNDNQHHSYKLKIVKPPPNTKEAEGGTLWVGIVLTFIVLAVIAFGAIKAYLMKQKVAK